MADVVYSGTSARLRNRHNFASSFHKERTAKIHAAWVAAGKPAIKTPALAEFYEAQGRRHMLSPTVIRDVLRHAQKTYPLRLSGSERVKCTACGKFAWICPACKTVLCDKCATLILRCSVCEPTYRKVKAQ